MILTFLPLMVTDKEYFYRKTEHYVGKIVVRSRASNRTKTTNIQVAS